MSNTHRARALSAALLVVWSAACASLTQKEKGAAVGTAVGTVAGGFKGIAVTFGSGLSYDFDSDVVRADPAQNLRTLAAGLTEYLNTDLLIVRHTDAVGTTEYNQPLSQRRAAAGVDSVVARGVGQANRRIEIAIVAAHIPSDSRRAS